MLKVFARFNTPEEHEKLVEGIIKVYIVVLKKGKIIQIKNWRASIL